MGKKLWSTVIVIGGAVGTIIGIIADAPQAMENVIKSGPDWMANPDVWWVVSIAVVTIALLWLVWRKSEHDLSTPESHLFFRVEMAVDRVGVAVKMALRKRFGSAIERSKFISQQVTNEFENVVGASVYSLYGATERDKYLRVFRGAKNPDDPLAAVKVATAYLGSFVVARANERAAELLKLTAAKQ